MRFEMDVANAFDELEAGQLDVMIDRPSPEDLAILASAHPDQIVAWPGPTTLFVGFDVQKPPFDDRRVRQAVNFAIDRGHAADLLGGSAAQRPTCQILPPNFQGYVPYCPYTLDPESAVWSAPDPARARSLIQVAGAVGAPVTVWVTDARGSLPAGAVAAMRYIATVLNEIGLRARFEIVADGDAYFGELYGAQAGTSSHPHVFMSGWIQDFPAASNFIEPQFRCGAFGNPSDWCSEDLDARIDEAQRIPADDPGAIGRAWSDIEHGLVDDGAQAPLTNPITTHAISARTENVQINPQWGMLLSLIWVQ
jgi:peptide/nickel transport system substrate-binding protein